MRRIAHKGALGLAMVVAMMLPASAMAAGTQNVQAGFSPKLNDSISIPPPVAVGGHGSSPTSSPSWRPVPPWPADTHTFCVDFLVSHTRRSTQNGRYSAAERQASRTPTRPP